MERNIPSNLDHTLVRGIIGFKESPDPVTYVIKLNLFEMRLEEKIIKLLEEVDIRAMVKPDRETLPFNKEIVTVLHGESWMNAAFQRNRVFRPIVKELLNKGLFKVRFYFHVEVDTDVPKNASLGETVASSFGKIKYTFRYYDPTNNK